MNSSFNLKLYQLKQRGLHMTIAKVLDVLENRLPAIDDEFVQINWGGCGVMAKIIAEQLDLLCVNYDIVCKAGLACDYEKMSNEQVNDMLTLNNKDNIPNSHVLIQVQGRIFDSEGEQFYDEDTICAYIDHATITRMLSADIWNSDFDQRQINGMRTFTQNIFNKAFGA